jgi:hypothetical protein
MVPAIIWKYGSREGFATRGREITEWPYAEKQPTKAAIAKLVRDHKKEVKKDTARLTALAVKWETPFDLLDDILLRGIDVVKAERDVIKKSKPKGKKGK